MDSSLAPKESKIKVYLSDADNPVILIPDPVLSKSTEYCDAVCLYFLSA